MSIVCGTGMFMGMSMNMPWMRMPGESWACAAASFTLMWSTMMIAMMLPSVAAPLWRLRQAAGTAGAALAAGGYFAVWSVAGVLVYAFGALLAQQGFDVPLGIVVIAAGVLQFSSFKARRLACCREGAIHGARLGMHCVLSCANWMAVLLVAGVMDLRAMALVTAAITLERIAPAGQRVARGIGVVAVGAGVVMLATGAAL